jgi:TonB-dependent SusC/RagA subfamily outer membrane receptor
MKTITILTVVLLSFSQLILSQNDTLTGVLRDAKNRPVRNHAVTLGSESPIVVKTNRQGVFTIPHANLNDTLYIEIKKDKNEIQIPVKGYNYLTINLTQTAYKADHRLEPSPELQEILTRERNKMISSSVMNKSEIEKSRCQDVYCLLRRLGGVTIVGGSIRIRGGLNSINSSNAALIVVNGVPSDESILNTFHINDIERIEALKEASLYGARGANGAIIITTGK